MAHPFLATLFRHVSQIPKPLAMFWAHQIERLTNCLSTCVFLALLWSICSIWTHARHMATSCSGCGGGGGEWFDWQLYEMLGKHPRGCSLLSLPSFLRLFVTLCCYCWVIPFAGYWRYRQYVLLVIVCLMDQTILIEFNYIACAFPPFPFPCRGGCSRVVAVVVGFSDLQ